MELAKVALARSTWLFDTGEWNPKGKRLIPVVTEAIKSRYRFLQYPTRVEDLDLTRGIKFRQGGFTSGDSEFSVDLEVFNDGVVASSQASTDTSDAFLEDLLAWLREQFSLGNENYILKTKRTYRSELVVFSPKLALYEASEKFIHVSGILSEAFGNSEDEKFEAEAIAFGSDPNHRNAFTLERRIQSPFSDHKYYSSAYLPTDKHLVTLEKIEEILAHA